MEIITGLFEPIFYNNCVIFLGDTKIVQPDWIDSKGKIQLGKVTYPKAKQYGQHATNTFKTIKGLKFSQWARQKQESILQDKIATLQKEIEQLKGE